MSEARFVNSAYGPLTAADLERGLLSIFTFRTDDSCFRFFCFFFLWWYRKIKTMVNRCTSCPPQFGPGGPDVFASSPRYCMEASRSDHITRSSFYQMFFLWYRLWKNNRRFHFLFYLFTSSLIYYLLIHIFIYSIDIYRKDALAFSMRTLSKYSLRT